MKIGDKVRVIYMVRDYDRRKVYTITSTYSGCLTAKLFYNLNNDVDTGWAKDWLILEEEA